MQCPFGPEFHGMVSKTHLKFDYIKIVPSQSEGKNVLMLRDDHLDDKWVFIHSRILRLRKLQEILFTGLPPLVPKMVMSDRPTNLKNETVRPVSKSLKVSHKFFL